MYSGNAQRPSSLRPAQEGKLQKKKSQGNPRLEDQHPGPDSARTNSPQITSLDRDSIIVTAQSLSARWWRWRWFATAPTHLASHFDSPPAANQAGSDGHYIVVAQLTRAPANDKHTLAVSPAMRETIVMTGSLPGSPLEGELSPTFDDDNHNGVSLFAEPSHMLESGENQPAGFGIQEPASAPGDSVPYPMSDDEGGMLSDGGVQLDISQAYAESVDLDTEMVHPDAEEYPELSSIPQSSISQDDADNETANGPAGDESDIMQPSWPQEHAHGAMADQISNLLDEISGLSQQIQDVQNENPELQHIQQQIQDLQQLQTPEHAQDGQQQGQQPPVLHGMTYDQGMSLHFVNPVPFTSPRTGNQLVHAGPIPPVNIPTQSSTGVSIDLTDLDPSNAPPANGIQVDDGQNNMTLSDFLFGWGMTISSESRKANRGPRLDRLRQLNTNMPTEVRRADLRGERCDIQGINWKKLEVERRDARRMRIASYKNYHNLIPPPWLPHILSRSQIQDDGDNFFKFRQMNFKHKINVEHFQLRNVVACSSRNNVFFASTARVIQVNPNYGQRCVAMNLSEPEIQPVHGPAFRGVKISTIAANNGILIAGGFHGEYGMMALSQPETKHVEGLVADHPNCITNHIQVNLNRQSGLPEAVIVSNDNGIRTLDCTTNKFTRYHEYEHAINCSAQSPDHRLRVLVGDTCDVMICNAETGEILQKLEGHCDYGFACDWADNGWHVATGNQDKLVKIWDARMWKTSDGEAKPLATIASTMAGVRSLKYSPLGSGKRVLLASEPADIISVIDAETYESKQTLDLFGEIAGTDFSPDGQSIFVGVHDNLRGGLMEFEKCGFGQSYQHESIFRKRNRQVDMSDNEEVDERMKDMAAGLDWKKTMADVVANPKSKRTATHRRRRAARLGDIEPY
ncbi:hypothetical protein V492_03367 [Pseudogymnoascus sp. VKM F-4246]|nr:hypothetical protein V492_03367 [Pseudogymnoascus sp. VKM F-4246]